MPIRTIYQDDLLHFVELTPQRRTIFYIYPKTAFNIPVPYTQFLIIKRIVGPTTYVSCSTKPAKTLHDLNSLYLPNIFDTARVCMSKKKNADADEVIQTFWGSSFTAVLIGGLSQFVSLNKFDERYLEKQKQALGFGLQKIKLQLGIHPHRMLLALGKLEILADLLIEDVLTANYGQFRTTPTVRRMYKKAFGENV